MKTLEIRRHTMRNMPGQHLSQAGVRLARQVGEGIGPFALVITSTLPRAFETAIAMGFAVDKQEELISTYGEDVEIEIPWPQMFREYAAAASWGGAASAYAERLSRFYHGLLGSIPEGGSALVINHGGIVELSAVACVPDADYGVFGPHCDYCEGIRLLWEQDSFIRVEIIRVQ
jgi:broad specificity phosphatase PhoE